MPEILSRDDMPKTIGSTNVATSKVRNNLEKYLLD